MQSIEQDAFIHLFDASQELIQMRSSFFHLPFDKYHPNGTRFRRHSQFRATREDTCWKINCLPHRPFIQKATTNSLIGGTIRNYDRILVDLESLIQKGFEQLGTIEEGDWLVNCHQFRVIASPGLNGIPVPEGPHRDGADYVLVGICDRCEISGGVTYLMYSPDSPPCFKTIVKVGQAIIFDDRKLYHYVDEIVPIKDYGHRDILIIGYVSWKRRTYGEMWEKEAISTETTCKSK